MASYPRGKPSATPKALKRIDVTVPQFVDLTQAKDLIASIKLLVQEFDYEAAHSQLNKLQERFAYTLAMMRVPVAASRSFCTNIRALAKVVDSARLIPDLQRWTA